MFTDVRITSYRRFINSLISGQYRILNKDEQADIKYADDYQNFSWWKKLWVSKPGEDDISRYTRYFANKKIAEYAQTLSRLDYEENSNNQTHTKIPHNSYFFEWIKNENLGS